MPKKVKLKDIVFLPPDKRRKFNFTKRKKKVKKRIKRRIFGRNELVEYLRSNDFRTIKGLEKGRGEFDPNIRDYIKEFGKWSNVKKIAFGDRLNFDNFVKRDAQYMVKIVVQFDLWKYAEWQEATKNDREVVPPMRRVVEEWGSFSNMIGYAYQVSMRTVLNRYIELWRSIGKQPSLSQCKEHGLNLEIAIEHFGGKREMDRFMKNLEI